MPIGKVTSCPWCGTVHMWGPTKHGRFCTEDCKDKYEAADRTVLNFQSMEGRLAAMKRLERVRDMGPVTLHCNRCVTTISWTPVDGGGCPSCGYQLSVYGPFDAPPTMWVNSSHMVFLPLPPPTYVWSASLPCVKPFPA